MIKRFLEDEVLSSLAEARVVTVLGARQVGKSTLVSELAGTHYPSASIYQLDNAETLARVRDDPVGFIADLSGSVVIDEIQRAPELLLAIKLRVDADNTPGQFLLTGSANLLALPAVADALPGRIDYLTLHPFSQGELSGMSEDFIDQLFLGHFPNVTGNTPGRRAYAEAVVTGGYPEAQTRTARGRSVFFESYLSSLIERDVSDIATVLNKRELALLLRVLATRSGNLTSFASISSKIDMTDKTLKSYAAVLRNLFLVHELQPWYQNLGQRLVKLPKHYIADSGLLCHLLLADAEKVVDDSEAAGIALETFVFCELLRQNSYTWPRSRFYFYRDRRGTEVDFVLERNDGGVVAVEAKAAASTTTDDTKGLRLLRDRLGRRFKAGALLYTGSETLPLGDRLAAVPISGMWQNRTGSVV